VSTRSTEDSRDIIDELGPLAFASRLKRLGEKLQKDVSRVYRDLDVDFEARWFSILYALKKQSPMTITALARSLRLTHPAVNQLAGEMIKKRLLLTGKGKSDERQRLLRLSAKGSRVAVSLEPIWQEIRGATEELIEEAGSKLLPLISRIENLLDDRNMYQRVSARLADIQNNDLEILDYRPAWKKHFQALNLEWLQKDFTVEQEDREVLSDPNGRIIKPGGAILFARLEGKIVATCALRRHAEEIFELTKMAVASSHRRRKIGSILLAATIERARSLGAALIILETSPKLVCANGLYRKHGFRQTDMPLPGISRFKRKSITMALELRGARTHR